jgi:hypothetical protein
LTGRPEGGWGDFVGLHPNRELPLYAAQDLAAEGGFCLPIADLHRFVRAHHVGGFTWLLRDRLADGQVAADDALLELGRRYTDGWRETLIAATENAAAVDTLIDDATVRWRLGTAAEHRALGAGTLDPRRYATLVRDKLAWISLPSRALLLTRGDPARVKSFADAHDLFLLGLQTVDDVIDRDEDRAHRGCDVPAALGCSAGALLRTAPKLVARSAALAAAAGFTWIASWLEAFGHAIRAWRLDGDMMMDEIEAIGLAGEIEETVLGIDDPAARAASAGHALA